MRASVLSCCLLFCLACSREPAAPAAPAAKHEPPKKAAAPLELQPGPRVTAPTTSPAPIARKVLAAPQHGCSIELEQDVATGSRAVALQLEGPAVAVANDAALTLHRLEGERFVQGGALALSSPIARISALCERGRCELAWVDQRMRVSRASATANELGAASELAQGADRRFAPAVGALKRGHAYAFTRTVDDAMHTTLVVNGALIDVTPPGHGAAAPTFILGAPPALVVVDAHAGISPLLEIPLDAEGTPRQAVVRTPISQPYAPPQLAAVAWADGQVEVFYTAVGKLAMTAVGRVPLRRVGAPAALSPSQGYGELSFAVARGSQRALFAVEVPVASGKDAQRKLELKLSDGASTSDGPTFEAPALRPSLSAAGQGSYLLAYNRGDTVRAVLLRCAD